MMRACTSTWVEVDGACFENATMPTTRKSHWEQVYAARPPESVSWFQVDPVLSLNLIRQFAADPATAVIDVGGGASRLVDALLGAGYRNVSVLDIAAAALAHAQRRLGDQARHVTWLESDITGFSPAQHYGLWHDRAVFHFLTEAADRRAYVQVLKSALGPNGVAILAAFAPGGPPQCSHLDVRHYDAERISAELDGGFTLIAEQQELHVTPAGAQQPFNYFVFRRAAS